MGYFPNSDAGDWYEAQWCNKCAHQGTEEKEDWCPIWTAHLLYSYQLCNSDDPGKHMLDMFIPVAKNGIDMQKCTMFTPRNGVSEKHLRDWEKYKAIMAEASGVTA